MIFNPDDKVLTKADGLVSMKDIVIVEIPYTFEKEYGVFPGEAYQTQKGRYVVVATQFKVVFVETNKPIGTFDTTQDAVTAIYADSALNPNYDMGA